MRPIAPSANVAAVAAARLGTRSASPRLARSPVARRWERARQRSLPTSGGGHNRSPIAQKARSATLRATSKHDLLGFQQDAAALRQRPPEEQRWTVWLDGGPAGPGHHLGLQREPTVLRHLCRKAIPPHAGPLDQPDRLADGGRQDLH